MAKARRPSKGASSHPWLGAIAKFRCSTANSRWIWVDETRKGLYLRKAAGNNVYIYIYTFIYLYIHYMYLYTHNVTYIYMYVNKYTHMYAHIALLISKSNSSNTLRMDIRTRHVHMP